MKFVAMYFEGDKDLLPISELKIENAPRNVKGLRLTELWPKYKDRKELKKYWPVLSKNKFPSRTYFFKVFATVLNEEYNNLLKSIDEQLLKKQEEQKKVVRAKKSILERFWENQEKFKFNRTKKIKRLVLPKK